MDSPVKPKIRDVCHPSLYYLDGDVVLSTSKVKVAAEDEDAITENTFFRVDSTVLLRQSTMLGRYMPNTHYDGVPHLQVPADSRDLAQLLSALYDMSTLNPLPRDPDMPLEMLGLLKLAIQYSIDPVRKVIQRSLFEAWPQTLKDWDDQRDQISRAAIQCTRPGAGGKLHGKYLDEMFPEPAAALHLSIECNIWQIVPCALYQLALIDPQDQWGYADEAHLRAGQRSARWELLDTPVLSRAELGRIKLIGLQHGQLEIPLERARDCPLYTCTVVLESLKESKRDNLDYLYTLKLLQDQAAETLCARCRPRTLSAIRAHRRAFWKNLPAFFNLIRH
ncbi:hypothetical protein EIP86_002050 [Pleurotus ostreatoroseus]|nr:hypothetical protein EIP86_002050 [Pleurotus ostreatoroseus]